MITDDFISYFLSFYGREGLYPITPEPQKGEIRLAATLIQAMPGREFLGDSFDREMVRDCVLYARGYRSNLEYGQAIAKLFERGAA